MNWAKTRRTRIKDSEAGDFFDIKNHKGRKNRKLVLCFCEC